MGVLAHEEFDPLLIGNLVTYLSLAKLIVLHALGAEVSLDQVNDLLDRGRVLHLKLLMR